MAIDEQTLILPAAIRLLNHKRDVYVLSWAFLLFFLAYEAIQNLESTINSHGDLGTLSLGILHASLSVSSVFASLVVRKMGSKYALLFGTTGCVLFASANLLPSWYTMVPASVYLGFANSIMWVAQGTYLTSAAHSYANDNDLHEGAVIGQFNGIFWGIFSTCQLVGNLVTFTILNDKGGITTGTTLLFVVFIGSMASGSTLICFLSKRNNVQVEQRPQHQSPTTFSSSVAASLLKPMMNLLRDTRILLTIPLFAYWELQQAFMWTEYTKVLVKPVLGERGVGGAMAIYGAFNAASSLLAGRLTSNLSTISIIVPGGALIQLIVLIWLLLNYSVSGLLGTLVTLLVGALWGIGDGIFITQISALLGILFQHDLEGAFAQLKLWQTGAIAVICFIAPSISLQTMILILLASLVVSVVSLLFLTVKVEKCFSPS